jgi:predicted small lipoprotein YifL
MKKILNLPIAILLLSSLVSCGNSKPQAKTPEQEREASINADMDKFFEFISSEMKVSASLDVQKNLKTAINKIVNTLLKEKENIQKSISSIKPDFITFQSEVNAFIEDDNTQNFLNSLIQTIQKLTPDEIKPFF